MKKKNSDILHVLLHFQNKIIKNKPSFAMMMEEIRMMKFKIRPLEGDVSRINFNDIQLIEALWNLGKIEDFFQNEYDTLSAKQKRVFFRFMNDIYERFQNQLNKVKLKNDRSQETSPMVEMEIFKDKPLRIN